MACSRFCSAAIWDGVRPFSSGLSTASGERAAVAWAAASAEAQRMDATQARKDDAFETEIKKAPIATPFPWVTYGIPMGMAFNAEQNIYPPMRGNIFFVFTDL
jgi:hypothetical protein